MYENPHQIRLKGVIDLVTEADVASEKEILAVLEQRFPGSAVLAEESCADYAEMPDHIAAELEFMRYLCETEAQALDEGKDFTGALADMKQAANAGRDNTKDLVAKIGRSSRLGDRSKGVIDPGAASCALILETMADTITGLIN